MPQQTVRIGFLGPLTGFNSEIGVQGRNSCELAVEEINRSGGINGKNLELVVGDMGSDADQALAAAKEMKRKGVEVIVSQSASAFLTRIFPYINSNKILFITVSASADQYKNKDDYFFRIVMTIENEAQALANLAYRRLKLRNISVLIDRSNIDFTESIFSEFSNRFSAMGGRIDSKGYFYSGSNDSMQDLANHLAANVVFGPKSGIFITANSIDTAKVCQYLAIRNITCPIITGQWAFDNYLIYNGGKTVDRIYLVEAFDGGNTNEYYLKFRKIFKDRYFREPLLSNSACFETVMFLADVMRKCRPIGADTVRTAMLKQKVFPGLQDQILLNDKGDADRKIYEFKIENGKFRKLD